MELGARLRAVREQSHLSQRQLAKRAGVSNATISLIESDRISPSVGALKRVLDGLPMSLSEFFGFELSTDSRQVFFPAAEHREIGKGKISYRQVGGDLLGRTLQILAERYARGADTGKVLLSHDGEEGAVIVSGRLEVTVGDQKRTLGPGDAYMFDSKLPHRFRNIGEEDCRLISACTPPTV
jgi:transcriptional regulator with XRE-family HTH domain